jgi:hypothetical protein
METLNGLMRPVTTTGKITFGGRSIVDAVYHHFLTQASRKMPKLAEANAPAKSLAKLREACIVAIHSLSKSVRKTICELKILLPELIH